MGRWQNKYVIGLTGNIAVGKSVVRQMLQHLGAYTIDADGLAHQAMSPGAPAYKPVVQAFGLAILNPDKTINRAVLGSMVFSNPDLLAKLEAITHPIIGQAINTLVSRSKQSIVVIEAIKLLEGDLAKAVDTVWVVNAKPQTQYMRLVGKRKMSQDAAKQRILGQSAQSEKLKAANVVINNDGNIEETWKQVQAGWNNIRAELQATAQPKQQQAPQPAPASAATPKAEAKLEASGIAVRRGMPSNAEIIASFINRATGQDINRMDVIMSFGQKSYLVADDASGQTVGIIGWQVENLITRVDELYLDDTIQPETIVHALVLAVEEASQELQSEVSFVFLPTNARSEIVEIFMKNNYEATTVKDIKIPAWREAVQEVMADDTQIFTKKLRRDRVLKPI